MGRSNALEKMLIDIRSPDQAIRVEACRALLRRRNKEFIGRLLPLLDDPDLVIRLTIVGLLSRLEAGQSEMIEMLQRDPSDAVRMRCAASMLEDDESTRALILALGDESERVVRTATAELANRRAQEAIPALRGLLAHESWKVRWDACESLARLGAGDASLLQAVRKLAECEEALPHDRMVIRIRRGEPPTRDDSLTTGELISRLSTECGAQTGGKRGPELSCANETL